MTMATASRLIRVRVAAVAGMPPMGPASNGAILGRARARDHGRQIYGDAGIFRRYMHVYGSVSTSQS